MACVRNAHAWSHRIQSSSCSKRLSSLKRFEISSSVMLVSLCKIQKCSPNPQGACQTVHHAFTTALMRSTGENLVHLNLLPRCCHCLLSPRHSRPHHPRIMSSLQQKLSPSFKTLLDVSNQTTRLMTCLDRSYDNCYFTRPFSDPRAWQEVTLPGEA